MSRYNLNNKYRGYAIIIINKKFKNPDNNRVGADKDKDMMKQLFTDLGFKVKVYQNLRAGEMLLKLDKARRWEHHKESDCFVCVVSTHGEELSIKKGQAPPQGLPAQGSSSVPDGAKIWKNAVAGIDERDADVPVENIVKMFDKNNCKDLIGKPKLFFIQACRVRGDGTNKYDYGVIGPDTTHPPNNGGPDTTHPPNNGGPDTTHPPNNGGGDGHDGTKDEVDNSAQNGASGGTAVHSVTSGDGPNDASGDGNAVDGAECRTNIEETKKTDCKQNTLGDDSAALGAMGEQDGKESKPEELEPVREDKLDGLKGDIKVDSTEEPFGSLLDYLKTEEEYEDEVDAGFGPDKNKPPAVPYDVVPIECPKDCLVMFPVGTGKLAMRNITRGSYLLQYLFDSPHKKEFLEGKMNLLQYLTMVCREISLYEYIGSLKENFVNLPQKQKEIIVKNATSKQIAATGLTQEQLLNLPFKMTAHVIHRLTDHIYFIPKPGAPKLDSKQCSLI